jgi:hypothetical protein
MTPHLAVRLNFRSAPDVITEETLRKERPLTVKYAITI